jgi:hypothetical protein
LFILSPVKKPFKGYFMACYNNGQMDGFLKTIASKAKQLGRWASTDLLKSTVSETRGDVASLSLIPGVGPALSSAAGTGLSLYDANQSRIAQADAIRAQDKEAAAYIELQKKAASAFKSAAFKVSTPPKPGDYSNTIVLLLLAGAGAGLVYFTLRNKF